LGGPPGAPAPSLASELIDLIRLHGTMSISGEAVFLAFDCPARGRRLNAA